MQTRTWISREEVIHWSGGSRLADTALSLVDFVRSSFEASHCGLGGRPSSAAVLSRVSQTVMDCLVLLPAHLYDLSPTLSIHCKLPHITVHCTHIFSFIYLHFHSFFCLFLSLSPSIHCCLSASCLWMEIRL